MWPGASVSENSDGGIVSSHGGGTRSRMYSGAESTLGLETVISRARHRQTWEN